MSRQRAHGAGQSRAGPLTGLLSLDRGQGAAEDGPPVPACSAVLPVAGPDACALPLPLLVIQRLAFLEGAVCSPLTPTTLGLDVAGPLLEEPTHSPCLTFLGTLGGGVNLLKPSSSMFSQSFTVRFTHCHVCCSNACLSGAASGLMYRTAQMTGSGGKVRKSR